MKTLIIALLLASSLGHAGYEAEIKITDLNYTWGAEANFPITLVQVGGSYYNRLGTGFSLYTGQSNERNSTVSQYKASVKNFFSLSINQSIEIDKNISAEARSSYTEYKSCVDGYGCNPDTSTGYGVSIKYRISDYSIKLSYDNYYEKQKTKEIKEKTNGYSLSIVAHF
jgi:hypothetical protein